MFGPPSTPLVAGLEALVVAAAFLGFGYLLADALIGRRNVDAVGRWGLAFPAVAGFVAALMLLHAATGGRILSSPWLVRALVGGLAGALIVRKVRRPGGSELRFDRTAVIAAVALVAVALILWSLPVFRRLPIDNTGDTPWHMGLATQLVNGETTPSGPVTGAIPNFYPWLYHAVVAVLSLFTPGGRAFHALGALQVLQVGGMTLGLFALGRELTRMWIGGAAASLFGAVAGGFGFFLLDGVDIVFNPRGGKGESALRYMGDLLYKRSYNVAFADLSPPFPRDVALLLLVSFLLLAVLGLSRRSPALLAAAGATLGLAGLAGGEAFLVGCGAAAILCVLATSISKWKVGLLLLGPAILVYAIWAVPQLISYLRLGGYVNITKVSPVDLTPAAILVSWGVATAFAPFGFFRLLRRWRTEAGAQVVLALLLSAGGFLLLSALIPNVGSGLLSLSRRHRYWPLLHLAVALFGAVGAALLMERVARWHRLIAALVGVVILALAVPSPAVASLALAGRVERVQLMRRTLRGAPDTVLAAMSPGPGHRCVIAVPPGIDTATFAHTGYRLVMFLWPHYQENRARLRWRNIYETIPGDAERAADNRVLVTGSAGPSAWEALVRKYRVDLVVVKAVVAGQAAFAPYSKTPAMGSRGRYVVIRITDCSG